MPPTPFGRKQTRRNRLKAEAALRSLGVWGGTPIFLKDTELTAAPRYPARQIIENGGKRSVPTPVEAVIPQADGCSWPDDRGVAVHYWRSRIDWRTITIYRTEDGMHFHQASDTPLNERLGLLMRTKAFVNAWDPVAERKAMRLLKTLVDDESYRQYMMLGYFTEASKRSQMLYMFRRGLPTVVASLRSRRILACLCLHPIGYKTRSFGGIMCPTDDVITHLQMVRGNEVMFWRKAHQHDPSEPEAGL